MNDWQRLNDLKENIELLYKKLSRFEKELALSANVPNKFELEERINREVLPAIRRYEMEYWSIYPIETISISEEEAKNELVQVEQAVSYIERIPLGTYPSEMIDLLYEIRDKLNEDKVASAKLKVVLPVIPLIASYEMEVNTEGFMYKVWKSLRHRILG